MLVRFGAAAASVAAAVVADVADIAAAGGVFSGAT
jgi:hypothetical protein